jgi:putative FmdB family regulatory protein
MPTYTYRCIENHRWESARPIAERRDPITCPVCGKSGALIITKAPHLMWYPGCPRPDFKK